MVRYIALRALAALPILAIVAVFIFSLIHVAPGDPAVLLAGDNATPAQVEKIRERLHLDEPLLVQFGIWLGQAVRLDLGQSIFSSQPVTKLIAQRLEPTFMIAGFTLLFAIVVAIPAGVVAAWKANTWFDRAVMGAAVFGFSVPVFVIGYALIFVFSVTLGWLPVQGYKPLADGIGPAIASIILPSVALAFVFAALIARVTRAAVLETLSENYVRTARAKGIAWSRILLVHALKNAAIPIVTIIGVGLAILIGGVVVTESVFNIPGIGRLTVDAIVRRDYPVVQGVILFFSVLLILTNLLIDLSYAFFDPRIRG